MFKHILFIIVIRDCIKSKVTEHEAVIYSHNILTDDKTKN